MNKQELLDKYGYLKEAFFALYWGQLVHKQAQYGPYILGRAYAWKIQSSYLELKPLSSISEEDIDDIISNNIEAFFLTELRENRRSIYEISVHLIDALRSKGYLLPFMGITVEELICMGWAKYKEG